MVEFLRGNRLLVGCERAADLRQHPGWGDRACPPVGVGQQVCQRALLHYAEARHGEAAISVWAQIAMASSSNATANRRLVGSSVASS
jgi:hypothetical protein